MKKTIKKISKHTILISFIFAFIMIINKLIFLFSTINKNLYDFNSYYYQWKFGKIHYTLVGSGKPILCVHSMNSGTSSYEFNKIVKSLSKSHRVYSIDLIGFGKSEKPKLTYTAYMYVQLLHDFINDVIQEETDIITSGNSNSFVSMLAVQDPTILKRLIFINPGDLKKLARNPNRKNIVLKYLLELPILGTLIYNMIHSKCNIRKAFSKSYFYNSSLINKSTINSFHENAHIGEGNNKYVYSSNLCLYNNVNISSALEQINNSIFIIQGNDPHISDHDCCLEYKKINPSIEYSYINNTKLFPHLEKPKSVLEVMSYYLSN